MFGRVSRGAVGALCALWLCGPGVVAARAQVAAPAADVKAVTLAFTPKVGETTYYKSTSKLSVSGFDIALEQTSRQVVKATDDKGVTIVVYSEGGKVVANGSEEEIPASTPVTMTCDKSGKLLTFKPERPDNPYLSESTLFLIALTDRVIFPDKPVKPGDTWTTELDNPQVKGKKVVIKTTFVGEEKAGDVPVWKVKQTFEADVEGGGAKMTSEATLLLDAANGDTVEEEQTMKNIPTMEGAIDWTLKMKRIPAPAASDKKPTAP
jgi:hypothetical protein